MTTLDSLILGMLCGLEGIVPLSGEGMSEWAWRALLGRSGSLPQEALDLFKVGTVCAVLFALRAELRETILRRPAWWGCLLLAAVPAAVFGPKIRPPMRGELALLPWGFAAAGTFLAWVAWSTKPDPIHAMAPPREEPNVTDTLLVGLSQVAAFCPGISRLGMAWGASRICGLSGRASLHFALLLSAPVLGVHLVLDGLWTPPRIGAAQAAVGIAAAFSTALLSIVLLREWMERAGAGAFAALSFLLAFLAFLS